VRFSGSLVGRTPRIYSIPPPGKARALAQLDDKIAVITGAGGGIGRAIAVELARAGATSLLVGRTEETLAASADAAREAGAEVRTLVGDVSRSEDVRAYVDVALEAFGRIDVLVNNAGIEGTVHDLAETPEDEFDRIIAVNLRGTFLGMRYVLPLMLERGSGAIVNMSSVAGERGLRGTSPYNASKHGVIGLTRSAAAEYAGSGIRINAVSAGMVDTRMLRSLASQFGPDDLDGTLEGIAHASPSARLAGPEEIASVVRFLASDEASFVNGAAWAVDGGALGTMGGSWR
jgi:NAD(P)-dependent dehydrogenase (short-subunit alcohol dehydrogenase family)